MSDEISAILSALVKGDHWMSADACATFLGIATKEPRRTFMQRVAPLPDFPRPMKAPGIAPAWNRAEVAAWAQRHKQAA